MKAIERFDDDLVALISDSKRVLVFSTTKPVDVHSFVNTLGLKLHRIVPYLEYLEDYKDQLIPTGYKEVQILPGAYFMVYVNEEN